MRDVKHHRLNNTIGIYIFLYVNLLRCMLIVVVFELRFQMKSSSYDDESESTQYGKLYDSFVYLWPHKGHKFSSSVLE